MTQPALSDISTACTPCVTAVSRLASSSTMLADLPPSSCATRLTVSAAALATAMPARVEPTLTEEQTISVTASASGMASISLSAPRVMPFCTRAEKPPMKLMPRSCAARSSVFASLI